MNMKMTEKRGKKMTNSKKVKYFMGGALAAGLTLILYKVAKPRLLSVLDDESGRVRHEYTYEDEFSED